MANAAAVITTPAPGVAAAAEPAGWLMDERDGFISWLRGEFAAANAIIDLLVVHLRSVADPGEYDHVAAAVQQRRHHWAPVIHMQQFFPVADVAFALQQVGWRRRAQPAQALGAATIAPIRRRRPLDANRSRSPTTPTSTIATADTIAPIRRAAAARSRQLDPIKMDVIFTITRKER